MDALQSKRAVDAPGGAALAGGPSGPPAAPPVTGRAVARRPPYGECDGAVARRLADALYSEGFLFALTLAQVRIDALGRQYGASATPPPAIVLEAVRRALTQVEATLPGRLPQGSRAVEARARREVREVPGQLVGEEAGSGASRPRT